MLSYFKCLLYIPIIIAHFTIVAYAKHEFYEVYAAVQEALANIQIQTPESLEDINQEFSPTIFPLFSDELLLNDHLEPIKHIPGLQQPLLITGTDPLSHEFIQTHLEKLQENYALGLVVNANSFAEFEALSYKFPALTFLPTNAEGLSKHFGINHYPTILIGNEI